MNEEKVSRFYSLLPYLIGTGLLLAILLNWVNRRILTKPERLVATVEENLSEYIRETNKQATSIMRYSEREHVFSILSSRVDQTFFLFRNEKLVYWSNNKIQPDYYTLSTKEDKTLYATDHGEYLLLKYRFKEDFEIFGLIELYREHALVNDYLQSGYNEDIFPEPTGIEIFSADSPKGLPVKYLNETIFNIDFNNTVKARSDIIGYLTIFLFLVVFILLGWFVWIRMGLRAIEGNFESSFIIFLSFLLILRYALFLFEFPGYYHGDRTLSKPLFCGVKCQSLSGRYAGECNNSTGSSWFLREVSCTLRPHKVSTFTNRSKKENSH